MIAVRAGGVVHDAAGPTAVITDVTHDSRDAGPGVLFAARPGQRIDGHAFAPTAVAAGAPALLVERRLDVDVPQIVVDSVAEALGPVAALVHGDPSADMTLVGVTGTNGKTTTAFMLESALAAAGHRTGLIGTVETRVAGEVVPGVRTTPEASDLQRLLRRMRTAGASAAAMEVSSHGLALGRVRGTRFAAVGFTNLSHDHLDFHADLDDYFAAKASLFSPDYAAVGVVNVDDLAGRRLAASAPIPVITTSVEGREPVAGHPLLTATDVELSPDGSRFRVDIPDTLSPGSVLPGSVPPGSVPPGNVPGGGSRAHRLEVRVRLPGAFNVSNALLTIALAGAAGIDVEAAAAGIGDLVAVPGRMERVAVGQRFEVIVDYAHTPDALERVLDAVNPVARRVLVVVGCGGDRDRAKRPVMGRVAAIGADLAVLTSDNPRSEDPQAILDEMEAGARAVAGARVVREVDRRAAIGLAIGEAEAGDVVVIAGKGHERVQELADATVPFDDREVAREALAARGGHR